MKKYEKNDSTSYILGISLIVEALIKIPNQIETIYLSSKAYKNKELEKMSYLAHQNNICILEDDQVIDKLSLKENCYGIAVFRKYESKLKSDRHIVLHGFNNEGELGTVLRSAVSFDFEDIVLVNSDIDIFDPKVIRASMGSFFHVNIKQYTDIKDYLNEYKYNIYPFINKANKELSETTFIKPYSIVIPYESKSLEGYFNFSYYLKHKENEVLSLTSLSSIVFNYAYHLNLKR